jgi:hypothetical protein
LKEHSCLFLSRPKINQQANQGRELAQWQATSSSEGIGFMASSVRLDCHCSLSFDLIPFVQWSLFQAFLRVGKYLLVARQNQFSWMVEAGSSPQNFLANPPFPAQSQSDERWKT